MSFSRDSGMRACCTSTLSTANSPVVSGTGSPSRVKARVARSRRNGPKLTSAGSAEGAPGSSADGLRRSTAWMRASSSRGLKGLGR